MRERQSFLTFTTAAPQTHRRRSPKRNSDPRSDPKAAVQAKKNPAKRGLSLVAVGYRVPPVVTELASEDMIDERDGVDDQRIDQVLPPRLIVLVGGLSVIQASADVASIRLIELSRQG